MALATELLWLAGMNVRTGAPLSDQIYNQLRHAIVVGALAQGAAIQEPLVAAHFGVSRTPVREALLRLRSDGLVIIKKQSGTFVAPIEPAMVEEGILVREALEPRVIEIAASRLSQREMAELESETRIMADATDNNDGMAFITADDRFHQILIEAGGFPHIAEIIARVNAQLDRVRHLSATNRNRSRAAVREHRAIIKALRDSDEGRAAELLRDHLRGSWTIIREIMSDRLAERPAKSQVPAQTH